MRVITGAARGRRLKEPSGLDTRPTTDRVKEGLFSALQFHIEGRQVLDLFAGTGQLGIECLSRGAAFCVFVEARREALDIVRENLSSTQLSGRARVLPGDALAYLNRTEDRFDLIFLDPPYEGPLLEQAIDTIAARSLLNPGGIAAAEHPAEKTLPAPRGSLRPGRTYRYGKIAVTLYHCPLEPADGT